MGQVRRTRWATAMVAVMVLAGCSASVDPSADPTRDPFAQPVVPGAQSGAANGARPGILPGVPNPDTPRPRHGRGVVTALVPAGSTLTEAAVRSFRATTGFSLRQVEVPADDLATGAPAGTTADVLLGLDPDQALEAGADGLLADGAPEDTPAPEGTALAGAPAASAYARDDVCVLADREWFSANDYALPTSFADVADSGWAGDLLVPDPAGSVVGRAFTRAAQAGLGSGVDAWWSALTTGGVRTGAPEDLQAEWTAASGAVDGGRPMLVAPRSLAAATLNDTGTESLAAAVPGTCLDRPLYSAISATPANADGAESLVAWLRGPVAQRDLATRGVAQPLEAGDAQGTVTEWSAPSTDQPLTLDEADVPAARERAGTWSAGTRGTD